VAIAGLVTIVVGSAFYSTLGVGSGLASVGAVLALLGAGVAIFTPANQKLAFASVEQEEYGVL
jgi:hypothetical protein